MPHPRGWQRVGTLCQVGPAAPWEGVSGHGAAPLQLLVGLNSSLLLLTPFCTRLPRLGCAVVRVEVLCGARVPVGGSRPQRCRAQPCSELSQLLPAPVGAGRGAQCCDGVADRCQGWAEQATSAHVHIAEVRGRVWPLRPEAGREMGSGCMKGASRRCWGDGAGGSSPFPSPNLMRWGDVAVGVEPVLSWAQCLLYPQAIAACPSVSLAPGWRGLWRGRLVVSGLPGPAGTHRVTHVGSGGC